MPTRWWPTAASWSSASATATSRWTTRQHPRKRPSPCASPSPRFHPRPAVTYARRVSTPERPPGERLTGGQALARSLVAQGVTTVFALPGVQLDWAFDALYDVRDQLRVIHVRHEQATAYMADGYARSTGQPGVCLMVPGPGLLNASAGLATAYACSSPVVCLTGQVDSHAIDAGYGLLHEVNHQDRLPASLTKWPGRALRPQAIPPLVQRAFAETRSGRPRPVALELPLDVLQATDDHVPASPRAAHVRQPPDPD